jgi:hypothetical protein
MPTSHSIASLFATRLDCAVRLVEHPKRPPRGEVARRTLELVPRCVTLRDLALWSGREEVRRSSRFWLVWQSLLEDEQVVLADGPVAAVPEVLRQGVVPQLEAKVLEDSSPWERRVTEEEVEDDSERRRGPRPAQIEAQRLTS